MARWHKYIHNPLSYGDYWLLSNKVDRTHDLTG